LTDNGVAFFNSAFAAAADILPAVIGRDAQLDDAAASERSRAHERSMATERDRLSEARALEARTRQLLIAFGGTPIGDFGNGPAPGPAGIEGWDNGPGAAGGAPASGNGNPPANPNGWDNGPGNSGAGNGVPPAPPAPASGVGDWDNRPARP
jgi:hypothetical protein